MEIILEISEELKDFETEFDEGLMAYFEKAAMLSMEGEDLDPQYAEISLTFVSEEEIKDINRDYREIDSITDVLSFPQYDDLDDIDEELPYILGDVVICVKRAREQAEEYGHSFERELVYLFVHSMYHLLGYDHMEEDEKAAMREKEEAVMAKLDLTR